VRSKIAGSTASSGDGSGDGLEESVALAVVVAPPAGSPSSRMLRTAHVSAATAATTSTRTSVIRRVRPGDEASGDVMPQYPADRPSGASRRAGPGPLPGRGAARADRLLA
jgi:hypothetical protein